MLNSSYLKIEAIGIILNENDALPSMILNAPSTGNSLNIEISPFDAEILIKDFLDEADDTAISWLVQLLDNKRPRMGVLKMGSDGSFHVQFKYGWFRQSFNHIVSLGEGLVISRHIDIPVLIREELFISIKDDDIFLENIMNENFFCLSPTDFNSKIAII